MPQSPRNEEEKSQVAEEDIIEPLPIEQVVIHFGKNAVQLEKYIKDILFQHDITVNHRMRERLYMDRATEFIKNRVDFEFDLEEKDEEAKEDQGEEDQEALSMIRKNLNKKLMNKVSESIACEFEDYSIVLSCKGPGAISVVRKLLVSQELLDELEKANVPYSMDKIAEEEPKLEDEQVEETKEAKIDEMEEEADDGVPFECQYVIFCGWSKEENKQLYDFFFVPPQIADGDLSISKKWLSRKSTKVSLDTLTKFVFPENLQHPLSTGRLIVFGEFGPLDANSNLCCGQLGKHIVRKHELDAMVKQIDEEDLLKIFAQNEVLSPTTQLELLRQVGKDLRNIPQISKKDMAKLFEDLATDENGLFSFHEMQKVIQEFRQKRVLDLKRISVIGTANVVQRSRKSLSKEELQTLRRHEQAVYKASDLALLPVQKIDDEYGVITSLLNKHTHKVADMNKKNHPSLVQNVRILRDEITTEGMIRWDSTCYYK